MLEIYACFERCDLYIGNDSGLMHLAAASGVPTLGLFGPSKELLYAPWGEKCLSVRTVENFENIHPEGFDHRVEESLMRSLTVDMVFNASENLLKK